MMWTNVANWKGPDGDWKKGILSQYFHLKLFDQNLALTAGQPFKSTEMMALNIYNSFYQSTTNMGIGQAKAVIFFVIVTTISLLQLYLTKKGDYQQWKLLTII